MLILGINDTHDASACIIKDGKLLMALAEERLQRIKNMSNFPHHAIKNLFNELPYEYNWLVGWYTETETRKPKILHYTEGGPWFENYRECEYSDDWKKELINLFSS